jgi:hypothetical protein
MGTTVAHWASGVGMGTTVSQWAAGYIARYV